MAGASIAGNTSGSDKQDEDVDEWDDGFVRIYVYQLSGDLLSTVRLLPDSSIGKFKAELKLAEVDTTPLHSVVVGAESYHMEDDYCKLMLTKAVRDAVVRNEGRRVLSVTVLTHSGNGQPCRT